MTQPTAPGLAPDRPDAGLFGVPQTRAPTPAPSPEDAAAGEADAAALAAAKSARQAHLEERQGVGKTLADQFFRRAFDAILSPGALLGAGAESVGTALDIDILRDFGRDLGEASTGATAADLLNELAGGRAGAVRQDFAEQEEARPLLSTIAGGAGYLATGLASGGVNSARAAIGVGALEGAGSGAQTAYENGAPISDVLASTGLGSLFGAALPAGFVGVQKGAQVVKNKLLNAELGETLKGAMSKFSNERAMKALGARGTDIRKLGRDAPAAEREMRQIATDVLAHKLDDGTPVFQATQSQEQLAERVLAAQSEIGAKLGGLRREVNEFVEAQAPQLRPVPANIAARIETEVIAPLAKSRLTASEAARVQIVADELRALGPAASLEDVGAYRKILKDKVYPKPAGPGLPPQVPEAALELQKAERIIEGALSKSTDDAVAAMGGEKAGVYQALKRQYQSFKRAAQISGKAELQDLGNRVVSPTDYLVGIGGFMHGGGLHGIAAAGLHHVIREHGSSVLAVLANKLARTPKPHFSVQAVGGREAQEALGSLAQARNFIRDAAASVGDNPNVRRNAEELAKNTIAERFAREAEDFDVTRWADRTPTPMQRVLHRKAILDTASQDMAATAERIASLRPELPPTLDVGRLGKLMKDADKPAAIGALQNQLSELANNVPPTSTGANLGYAIRRAADKLETAEAAEAMQIGHAIRLELEQARRAIGVPTDAEAYKFAKFDEAFTERADMAIREVLSSEPFGSAAAHYAAATNRSDALEKLADPMALREALRKADQRGPLPSALHDANDAILRAAEARAALTGEKMPAGLERALRDAEELFAAGEEAATLDGRSVLRIFKHLDDTQPTAPDPRKAVWDAVAPEIDKLVPVIKSEAGQSTRGRYRPGLSKAAAREANEQVFALPEEQRIEYDKRLDRVASVMSDPRQFEDLGVPPEVAPIMGQKLDQFLTDVPKPKQDIRGKAFETMSSNDLRLAAAMFEATVRPLSVLSDFRAGIVDYDKVQYAWKQWPGLQLAVQAGILDVLQQDLDDEEREGLSDTMLTQLDYLAGFGGRLQTSLDPAFSARISTLNQAPEQAKPPSGGAALSTPKAEPTFTERVAGAQT